jgi:hypothetical protein
MRFPAHIALAGAQEQTVDGTLLGLPAAQLERMAGWRPDFSPDSRAQLARRLGAATARLTGPRLRAGGVRLWVRSAIAGTIVLELLEPGQRFTRLALGTAQRDWRLLRGRVPRAAILAGITLSSALPPSSADLELGSLRQRGAAIGFGGWVASTTQPGRTEPAVPFGARHGPVRRGTRLRIGGPVPLIRPGYRVPDAIPAIVGEDLARRAVDGRLDVMVDGWTVPVRVAGRAALFPTVTRAPRDFVVVDYATLFALLNADRPGAGVPHEAWLAGAPRGPAISRAALAAANRRDAPARAVSGLLAFTVFTALALAAAGLGVAAATALRSERAELMGWLALGAGPQALATSLRLRILLIFGAGAAAAVAGSLLALWLVSSLVAVSATGGAPLPPFEPRLDALGSAAVLGLGAAGAAAVAARLVRVSAVRLRARA